MRRATQLPQQLYNRWLEFRGSQLDSKFDKNVYSNKEPDNCVTLNNGNIFVITKVQLTCNGQRVFKGTEFLTPRNYFERPIESSVLGIQEVQLNEVSRIEHQFTENEIKFKNVLFPTFEDDKAVVIPILHYL